MKRILSISGGGLKGVIPATVLANLEAVTGKKCCEIFDFIAGTSTGSILGGVLASGQTTAQECLNMYLNDGKKLFTPKVPIIPFLGSMFTGSIYDRNPFMDKICQLTNNSKFGDVKTEFMSTAFNICSGRTHFIYSTNDYEKKYKLADVISWSALSAVMYFGKINVDDFKWNIYKPDGTVSPNNWGAVFQDGGQGTQNNPLGACVSVAVSRKWIDEDLVILSLGCGEYQEITSYKDASHTGLLGQSINYLSEARNESDTLSVIASKFITSTRPNVNLIVVNCSIPKDLDVLDGVKYISDYKNAGDQLKNSIPFELFK